MDPRAEDSPYRAPVAAASRRTLRSDWKDLPSGPAFVVVAPLVAEVLVLLGMGGALFQAIASGFDIVAFVIVLLIFLGIAAAGVLLALGLIRRARWAHFLACLLFFLGGVLGFWLPTGGVGLAVMSWVCFYQLVRKEKRQAAG